MSYKNAATAEELEAVIGGDVPVAEAEHAGSADSAAQAAKVGDANVGSSTRPVYLDAGTPKQCGNTLNVSITGNAATATNAQSAAEAGHAASATNAQNATNAETADHATSADSATSATSATSAASATKATQDGQGRVIADTYAVKPVYGTVSIATSRWSSNQCVLTSADGAVIQAIKTTSYIQVSLADASAAVGVKADVKATAQGNGTLPFTCGSVPTAAVTVAVAVFN